MLFQITELGYPITVTAPAGVACGNHPSPRVNGVKLFTRHENRYAVARCFEISREQDAQADDEARADHAHLVWLENQGTDEAVADRAIEDARGVVQFSDAMQAAYDANEAYWDAKIAQREQELDDRAYAYKMDFLSY